MNRPLGLFTVLFFCVAPAFSQREATLLDHQDRIRVAPVSILNSPYRETNLSITPDGKYLYFMSLRGGQYWSQKTATMQYDGQYQYDGDIWYSQRVNGQWQPPKCLPMGINTADGEDEPAISPDGKTVYFQSWNAFWKENNGPYYKSTLNGGVWGPPQGLGGGVTEFCNTYNATDGMSISPDGKRIVIACGKESYTGNMDIFMAPKGSKGWGSFKRLPISTAGDERSVFIAKDGRTLYFASNGYKGYGGLDIFKATINDDGSLGEVVNIGAPFNTPKDDYGFILAGNGLEAYFVRNGDVYYADLRNADTRIRPEFEVGLSGIVRDSKTQLGLKADITVVDLQTKRVVKQLKTGARGKYTLSLPNRTSTYEVSVICAGYPNDVKILPISKADAEQAFSVDFLLDPVAVAAAETAPRTPAKPIPPPSRYQTVVEPLASLPIVEPPPPPKPPLPPVVAIATPAPDVWVRVPIPHAPEKVSMEENPFSFDGVATNNLIFLLDVSASMNPADRLPLFKKAMRQVLKNMRAEDRISVIMYAGEVNVVIDGESAIQDEAIARMIDEIGSGGETEPKHGIRRAYQMAKDSYIENGNNRIVMITDGGFAVEEVYGLVGRHAGDGVPLSVFSFGKQTQTKEKEMSLLAHKGQGNYVNVTPENAVKVLLNEARAVRKM